MSNLRENSSSGSGFQGAGACDPHNSLYLCPPDLPDLELDILCALAQDDNPSRNEWDQLCDGAVSGPKNPQVTAETSLDPWGTSPTNSPDALYASLWQTPGLDDRLWPNTPNETFPMPELHPPTLYHQQTESAMNAPPLERVGNSSPALRLEIETCNEEILQGPVLQAAASEASRTEHSYAGATRNTPNRSMSPPSSRPLPGGQPPEEWHFAGIIESRPSLVSQKGATDLLLPSLKGDLLSAGPSSLGKRRRSPASVPPHHANGGHVLPHSTLPTNQPSLPENVAECENSTEREAAHHTTPCTSSTEHVKPTKGASSGSKRLGSRALEATLVAMGFKLVDRVAHCECGLTFERRRWYDAARHVRSSERHRDRPKSGDFEGSTLTRQCDACGEVLSRADSLARHQPHCGKRKKRRRRHAWNTNDDAQ